MVVTIGWFLCIQDTANSVNSAYGACVTEEGVATPESLCKEQSNVLAAMSVPVEETEVVVVGGGPVGLSAAASLNYYGIKTTLVEMKPTTTCLAKAQHVTGRSVEHFRRIGLEKAIQNASWPRDERVTVTLTTQVLNGHILVEEHLSSWGEIVDGMPGCKFAFFEEGVSPCAPLICPQNYLEPLLKQHLEGSDNVTMLWGWKATFLDQDENGVTIALSKGEGEAKQEKCLHAKYVIACDGGRSSLRKQLNVHTYGKYVVARAVSIMLKSDDLFARLRPSTGHTLTIVNLRNFQAVLVNLRSDGDYAMHIVLPKHTSDEKMDEIVHNPSQIIATVIGENVNHTVTAITGYNLHAVMTTKFCVGRCFFAGDSAHQWLPSGGLGMNTGIEDAFNLTWKIASVLKGYGGPYLLESFEVESKPKSDATRRYVISFGEFEGLGSEVRHHITSNPFTRFIFRQILAYTLIPLFKSGQKIVFGYQFVNSNVIVHEFDPCGNLRYISTSDKMFVRATYPGLRAPHVVLPDCSSIIDLFGKGFVLLVIGGSDTDCRELREEFEKQNIPLSIHVYPKLPELIRLYDRKFFLIRPDGIISWRSDTQPNYREAQRIIGIITGDVPPGRVSPFQLMKSKPFFPAAYLYLDVVMSLGMGSLLHKYAGLNFKSAVGIGLGAFWFLRSLQMFIPPESPESTGRHKAAVIKQFGKAEEVFEIDPKYVQTFGPNDILIRVHAVSVNPIDVKIRKGYIAFLLQRIARLKKTPVFPILLGRDCSGEVVAVGDNVTKFVAGDKVYAVTGSKGCYAQLAVVSENSAALKPESIDYKGAASIAFVAATAYSALVENVGLNQANTRGKKVLVHSGTGGVGSFSVQFLKAWGAEVTVTCSAENIPLAHSLGADYAIDYKQGDFSQAIQGYDVVLDTIGFDYEYCSLKVLKAYSGASYVRIINPRLTFLNKFPFLGEVLFSWYYRYKIIINRVWGGRAFYYSIANPNSDALQVVGQMIDRGEIKPLIDAVYSLDEIVAAHQHVEDGHTRGKVVMTIP